MPTDRLYALVVTDGFCESKDGTCMAISLPDMASAKTYVQILPDKLKKREGYLILTFTGAHMNDRPRPKV